MTKGTATVEKIQNKDQNTFTIICYFFFLCLFAHKGENFEASLQNLE